MEYEEAVEWLKGNRSTCNQYYGATGESSEFENAGVLTAQTDSAMTQQAYWIVKARQEGLTTPTKGERKEQP